ncbi:anthrone oxygenase family protein [Actinomyces sp. ZJ308]|uniref:anthrone oxygenase family protein n=1 Tax=Actinomyces sp. ZJ308 TaxID=2708342 RepID=UPI001420B5AF|nr:anthrone oxygenase family protein [Actinomyces sp. ZJ308]
MSLINIVSACGAVGSAVVGSVYTNFSARVMPWLGSLPDAEAIETMQKFNRTAGQAPFMTFFFGTAAASVWTVVHGLRKEERAAGDLISTAGGVLYLAGWVLTIIYNVPRNNLLDSVVAGSAEASRVWHTYLHEWTSANTVRAVLSLLGAAGLGAGAVMNILANRR